MSDPATDRDTAGRELPSTRVLVVVGLLAAIVLFAAGVQFGSSDERTGDPDPTPVEAAPSTTTSTANAGRSLNDVLGERSMIISDVTFASGVRALLVCTEDEHLHRFEVVQLTVDGGIELVTHRSTITEPTRADACEACVVEVDHTIGDGDVVVFGSCPDGGTNGVSTGFALADPERPSRSALALRLRCGGTFMSVSDATLTVVSRAPKAGSAEPSFWYPPISFERRGLFFAADDPQLMYRYCNTEGSTQLIGPNWQYGDYELELTFESVESEIGQLGRRGSLLLGLDDASCSTLSDTFWENALSDSPEASPLADLIGLAPPPGETDWYFTCQVP